MNIFVRCVYYVLLVHPVGTVHCCGWQHCHSATLFQLDWSKPPQCHRSATTMPPQCHHSVTKVPGASEYSDTNTHLTVIMYDYYKIINSWNANLPVISNILY